MSLASAVAELAEAAVVDVAEAAVVEVEVAADLFLPGGWKMDRRPNTTPATMTTVMVRRSELPALLALLFGRQPGLAAFLLALTFLGGHGGSG